MDYLSKIVVVNKLSTWNRKRIQQWYSKDNKAPLIAHSKVPQNEHQSQFFQSLFPLYEQRNKFLKESKEINCTLLLFH